MAVILLVVPGRWVAATISSIAASASAIRAMVLKRTSTLAMRPGRHRVDRLPALDQADVDRGPALVVGQRVERLHLAAQFLDRAHSLLVRGAGMGGLAGDLDGEEHRALAAGDDVARGPPGLGVEDRARAAGGGLDGRARGRRGDLLVRGEQRDQRVRARRRSARTPRARRRSSPAPPSCRRRPGRRRGRSRPGTVAAAAVPLGNTVSRWPSSRTWALLAAGSRAASVALIEMLPSSCAISSTGRPRSCRWASMTSPARATPSRRRSRSRC